MIRNILAEKNLDYVELFADEDMLKPLGDDYVVICFSSSNEYSPVLSVAVKSLIDNTDYKYKYDIVILNEDITESNKSLIYSIVNRDNCTLRFVNIRKLIADRHFFTWAHFTSFTYYRLLIPDIFAQYTKVLYLDSDIVVKHDVSELFFENIDDYIIAGAMDTHVASRMSDDNSYAKEEGDYFLNELQLKEGEYVQAGVLLFNVKEFHKKYKKGELIDIASNRKYRWLDQDLLNVECRGDIKILSNKWNVMVLNTPSRIDEVHLRSDFYEEYIHARRNPYIVHYIGRSIPCFKPSIDMYYYWWQYARLTPYYELLIHLMVSESEKRSLKKIENVKDELVAYYDRSRLLVKTKRHLIDPTISFILPKGTKRREFVRSCWWKIIGHE